MFIFKKFQKQNDPNNAIINSNNIRPMDQHLQKKFSRGIQYNSKYCLIDLN